MSQSLQMHALTRLFRLFKKKLDSVVYTNSFKSDDVLAVLEFKHHRINHSKLMADKHNQINANENFGTTLSAACSSTAAFRVSISTSLSRCTNGASTISQLGVYSNP